MLRLFLLLDPFPAVKLYHCIGFVVFFVVFTSVLMLRFIGQLVGTQMKKISAGRIFFFFSP